MGTSSEFKLSDFIYLASQSPRRQELLAQMGVRFKLLLPETKTHSALRQELLALEALEAHQAPESAVQYVNRVTRLKYQAARLRANALGKRFDARAPILCADTTVCLDKRILGKPRSAKEAKEMISALSGRTHQVYTSVIMGRAGVIEQRLSRSRVSMGTWSSAQINAYVASKEWMGKAGGYAIQGQASSLISSISGSYSGIMGLPLFEVCEILRGMGLEPLKMHVEV
jgi:septum formation protein